MVSVTVMVMVRSGDATFGILFGEKLLDLWRGELLGDGSGSPVTPASVTISSSLFFLGMIKVGRKVAVAIPNIGAHGMVATASSPAVVAAAKTAPDIVVMVL